MSPICNERELGRGDVEWVSCRSGVWSILPNTSCSVAPGAVGVRMSNSEYGGGETRSGCCGARVAVGVSWKRSRDEGGWKGVLSMLLALVLALMSIRTGCCMDW